MPNPEELKHKVEELRLSVASLFKLLGSQDSDKRWEYWEIMKGITTRAEYALTEQKVDLLITMVKNAHDGAQSLHSNVQLIGHERTPGQ